MDQTLHIERRPGEAAAAFRDRCHAYVSTVLQGLASTLVGDPTLGFKARTCTVVLTLEPPHG